MGAAMRTHDWSGSPLGAPEAWPACLRSTVSLLLGSRFPMFVAFGSELGFLYNDAYSEILGDKHPAALGGRFQDIWAEIWTDISPLIDRAIAGEPTWSDDLPLTMNRRGYDEQTWFTFSYSPVRDEQDRVAGMFCACTETTGASKPKGPCAPTRPASSSSIDSAGRPRRAPMRTRSSPRPPAWSPSI